MAKWARFVSAWPRNATRGLPSLRRSDAAEREPDREDPRGLADRQRTVHRPARPRSVLSNEHLEVDFLGHVVRSANDLLVGHVSRRKQFSGLAIWAKRSAHAQSSARRNAATTSWAARAASKSPTALGKT